MLRGSNKPLTCTVLTAVLFLIALIQVLPQVDLPDTAFHENETPAVTKFRLLRAPVSVIGAAAVVALLQSHQYSTHDLTFDHPQRPVSRPLFVLVVSFLC